MADPIFNFQSSNPFGLSNVGAYASPTFVDIDGDGDLDAFVGNSVGNILFFENTGSASSAAFASRITNPFGLSAVGSNASPTFVDIDGDGDLDAFVGNTAGEIWFFRNTPHSSAPNTPVFSLEATNPFGLSNVGNFAAPTFVDIDGDGDLDAFVGNRAGEICFFRNTPHSSAPNTPVFSLEATNPFGLSDVKWNASPTFVDIDGDGNLDAFVVNNFGEIRFFRNTPHSSAPNTPVFSLETTNLFGLSDVGSNASPTFVDIDGDGDLDAFVGNMHGNTLFFLNEPPPGVNIAQTGGSTAVTEGGATDTYTLVLNAAPTAEVTITLDNTNKQVTSDVATLTFTTANWNVAQTVTVTAVNDSVGEGKHSGVIKHTVTSTGSNYDNLAIGNVIVAITDNDLPVGNPTFNTPSTNPFGLSAVEINPYKLSLVDIDGDGDLDAFIGNYHGETLFYKNTGSASTAAFAAPVSNPFGLSNASTYHTGMTFVDIDGDGDLDAFIGNNYGDTWFYKNTGNASTAAFAAPVRNPFGLSDVGVYTKPTFVDIDGDGDLDAFIGNNDGNTLFFRNTPHSSAPNTPVFSLETTNPFGLSDVGDWASPTFVDIDGDGDLDAFIGNSDGNTLFFRNTPHSSAPNTPVFSLETTNPFGLSDVGDWASPTFVDIDGDGDLDAFIGNSDGNTLFFLNEPPLPGVNIAQTDGSTAVTEGGATDTYTVVLNAAPTAEVTITLDNTNKQVTSDVATLTFTTANWNLAQTVTVTAVNDSIGEGKHSGVIKHTVTSTGSNYDSLAIGNVIVAITDNNLPVGNPTFNTPSTNPFGLSAVSGNASATFVDIDGDGDLDAFVVNVGNTLFFENTGSASTAAFASSIANPFGLSNASNYHTGMTLVDIDGDGDLDAFIGNNYGNTWFYKNTGSASTAAFAAPVSNPFGLSDVGNNAAPTFVDIDGDGDLDAFVGNNVGNILFFENTGSTSSAAFASSIANPFGLSAVSSNANPTFVDIDGDGDLDAFVGNHFGNTLFFRNTPDSSAPNTPVFSLETTNPFGLSDVGYVAAPTFVDIDGDGDLDAFIGNSDGNTLFFLNEPPPGVNIAQTGDSTAVTEGGATDTYTVVLNAAPTAEVTITLDNTNKQVTSDVATLTFTTANWNVAQTVTVTAVNDSVGEGKHSGVIKHTVTSTGSNYDNLAIGNVIVAITDNDLPVGNPTFNTPSTNPFGLSKVGTYASPTLVDIDGDGDLDAFVGNRAGDILFFENTGSASSPVFAAPSTNPFGLSNGGWSASPTFVDIDGDGDLDAFVGNWNGDILFFENTGNASSAAFAAPVTNDPFGLSTVGNSAAPTPTFVDIDGDGDLDAFVGNGSGDTLFFENTGNASSAAFTFISSNPFGLSKVEWNASPTFVDIDGDGDLDAFVGNMTGNTWFFENTGSASGPAFAYPVSSNPFGLSKVDNYAAPTFVDIDGDGDLDAFVGNGAGDILFFLNDNTPPVFASATVNGNTLVMSYTEATTLDAVNIPFPGAFVVLVGATANTVTAVVVNAVNKTVTLTLASAVANGNTVTVAYNDPTVNNDVNAIQDAGGTDAATLTATLVTNDTPAPTPGPSPAPSPSPVPAPVPTTEKLDGVVVTRTTATATATVTHPVTGKEQIITTEVATTTIPIIHDTRTDTNNATPQADIPLVRDRSGDTILQASLPVGVGLTSEAISGGDNLTLRELLMVASGPRTDASSFIDILGQGIDSYVTGVADETQVTVRTLTFQTDPGASDQIAAPNAPPIAINGEQNHPDHQKALIIDVRNLPHGSVLQLNNVEFAIIIGAIKLIGGSGRNIIIADNADQFIVLGADDDVLRGGGGDDTVGSLDGNDQTFGDEGNDVVYGGAGNDQLSGGSGNDQMNGGFGFDVALQLGALSDYQVMRLGSSVILTHNSSGEQDSFTDVEQIRFDSGPALTLAHSQAEAVAGHLVATWLHRNLTADEGTYVQHYLSTASADDVVKAFLTLPETANLTTRSSDGLLAGLNTNPSILNLDVHRDLIFSAANDQGYLPFGLALTVDGGAGFDVLHLSGTRKDMHLAQKANVLELTQLKDGCMLNLINAEILAFDSGETVVLAHNPTEGILGRLVHTFFNRDATINEWQQGLQALQAHVAPDTILNWFQDRANLQGLNNNDYIQTLHQNTFNRAASLEELGHYQQQLDQGTLDRNGLAVELAASSEAIATVGTVMQFEGWL